MGNMETLGGAIHKEEMKGESYFATHVKAAVIGTAVAVALIGLAVWHFF